MAILAIGHHWTLNFLDENTHAPLFFTKSHEFSKELIMKLSRFLLYVLLASWLNLAFASTTTNSAEYKPKVGQEGKDVIWVPTPKGLIDKMLEAAKVSDKDT